MQNMQDDTHKTQDDRSAATEYRSPRTRNPIIPAKGLKRAASIAENNNKKNKKNNKNKKNKNKNKDFFMRFREYCPAPPWDFFSKKFQFQRIPGGSCQRPFGSPREATADPGRFCLTMLSIVSCWMPKNGKSGKTSYEIAISFSVPMSIRLFHLYLSQIHLNLRVSVSVILASLATPTRDRHLDCLSSSPNPSW